jgi:hypothetical protein
MSDPSPDDYLAHFPANRKTGDEPFFAADLNPGFTLLQFWQWSVSDLVSNATRGRLAEFIIASALGIAWGVRNEWDAFDLTSPRGLKIEVKSCGYLQSWKQTRISNISFSVRKSRAWDAATGILQSEPSHQSDLYIFALLEHRMSKKTLNPLDLDQWRFFLVPTRVLAQRKRSQHSITLKSLEKLCPVPLHYRDLAASVAGFEVELLHIPGSVSERH